MSVAPGVVALRPVRTVDIPTFFDQQLDPTAQRMVAFNPRDPEDGDAFTAHWERILADDAIIKRTILAGGDVAGYIVCFANGGATEIGYWLGSPYWGRGIATRALGEFLRIVGERPLEAVVAADNVASVRVLEKCGFVISGERREASRARGEETVALVLTLRA